MSDSKTVKAQYWWNRNCEPIPATLTGKRIVQGEWCYLAAIREGKNPQWIQAKRFTDFGGDPQKLRTYPELGSPKRRPPAFRAKRAHHWTEQ